MSTKKNSLYNIGGPLISVAIMLATVPLYLEAIGEARFGILAIVWLLTSYFGLFELGMGRVANYNLARVQAGDLHSVRANFWTSLAINGAFGLIGAILLLLIARWIFTQFFGLPPQIEAELFPALPWIAFAIPALTLENVISGAMAGRQRFLALNIRASISTALSQIGPLIAVLAIAPTLTVAIPAVLIARWISVLISLAIATSVLEIGWKVELGGRAMARNMLGLGGWLGLADGLRMVLAGLDRMLIGAYLGAASVAHYTVPYQLVLRGGVFAIALPNALFPRLAGANPADMRELALRGLRANAALMLVLCTIGMLAMDLFLTLWISREFAERSAIIGQLIALSLWLSSVAVVPLNLIQAQGRMRETAFLTAAQYLPFLLVAFPGMTLWGIAGVALARNASSLGDMLLVCWRAQMLRAALGFLIPSFLFLMAVLLAARLVEIGSISGGLIALALVGTSIWGAARISPDLRAFARSKLSELGMISRNELK